MKTNLPITDQEVLFSTDEVLVSETDLKGIITYANPAFIRVSGYSIEELIGKSHNTVRHPDMPPAAFADLWNTIKSGKAWRGLVKNRCKNGDFYWVEAFVTPRTENGQTKGYISVRSVPNRESVRAAETIYKAIQAGNTPFPETKQSLFNRVSFFKRGFISFLLFATPPLFIAGIASHFQSATTTWISAALLSALTLVSGTLWIWLTNQSLDRLTKALGALKEGRFTERLDIAKFDEFPDLLSDIEQLRIHWKALVADLKASSNYVVGAASELYQVTGALSADASDQVDRVNNVSAGLEELSVAISETAQHAHGAAASTSEVGSSANTSREHMSSSRAVSVRVVTVVEEAQQAISKLEQAVSTIGVVTQTIKEIADQTNLLALNAAIEAARAGEQGRGFAVVADEVRKLAERTSASTLDISNIVEQVRVLAQNSVDSMKNTNTEVKTGVDLIGAAHDSLEVIAEISVKANLLVSEIDDTILQQSSALQEIAQAVEQMSGAQESSSNKVKSVEAVARNLNATAQDLNDLVRHLKL